MRLFTRARTYIKRHHRAEDLGFAFYGARRFKTPNCVRLNGHNVSLHFPDQATIAGCFLEVLVDDGYKLSRFARRGVRTVLDVGANVGFFAIAVREVIPDAVIHCYEPNPAAIPYLQANAEYGRYAIHAEAIGFLPGSVSLDEQDMVNVRSRIDPQGTVPQASFREALERIGGECDLVKLDCEGAEWDILEDKRAWSHVRHVAMEYHLWNTDRKHDDAANILCDLGFRVWHNRVMTNDFGVVCASRYRTIT